MVAIIIIIIIIIHQTLNHHDRHLHNLLRHTRREIIVTQVGRKKTVGRHPLLLLLWHRLIDLDLTISLTISQGIEIETMMKKG